MSSDRYAVIGHPVRHSLSPRIHAHFAELTGEDIVYELLEAPEDGFSERAGAFFDAGGRGLNVTVPFKAEARAWAVRATGRADAAAVANTLTRLDDGSIEADNTDGTGLVRDLLANVGLRLSGARILLVGAGGAARGVLGPLLAERPASLFVANRTPERAHSLADAFSGEGPVHGGGFEELGGQPYDLVINASASSLGGELPPLAMSVVARGGTVYDMMYGEAAEPFLRWGREAGAESAHDGFGMLVEQAAESFRVWRGVMPPTEPVLTALRGSG